MYAYYDSSIVSLTLTLKVNVYLQKVRNSKKGQFSNFWGFDQDA